MNNFTRQRHICHPQRSPRCRFAAPRNHENVAGDVRSLTVAPRIYGTHRRSEARPSGSAPSPRLPSRGATCPNSGLLRPPAKTHRRCPRGRIFGAARDLLLVSGKSIPYGGIAPLGMRGGGLAVVKDCQGRHTSGRHSRDAGREAAVRARGNLLYWVLKNKEGGECRSVPWFHPLPFCSWTASRSFA